MEKLFLRHRRDIKTEKSTIGVLTIDGNPFKCYLLEDCDRGLDDSMPLEQIERLKKYGITCIPSGTYRVTLTYSNRFKRILPLITPVKGFVGIRIHPGNTDVDTLGCPLTGYKIGKDKILPGTSKPAFDDLFKILEQADKAGKEIYIEIK